MNTYSQQKKCFGYSEHHSKTHARAMPDAPSNDTITHDHESLADMVAAHSASTALTVAHKNTTDALALVNTITTDQSNNPLLNTASQHPDQYWDGRRETLGSWFTEFETVLSTVSPELYEFAVEYILSDRTKTVIFIPGQAAQLDGALPRPDYSWATPAPSDTSHYNVPHHVVVDAYRKLS